MSTALPANPNLSHLKKQAKDLLKSCRSGNPQACSRLQQHLPRISRRSPAEILAWGISLHDAQHVVAREYAFDSWASLREGVAEIHATRQSEQSSPGTRRLARLDDTLRRHIDALGFGTGGGYRIWCHKQGLDSGLDKSSAQLQQELDLARRLASTRPPPPGRGHRRGQAERITRIYETASGPDKPRGWLVHLFDAVADQEERDALYRLLIHLEKYTRVELDAAAQLSRRHRDWLRPVEEWFPQSKNRNRQLAELTRYLLGREDVRLFAIASALQDDGPVARRQRAPSEQRGSPILALEELASFQALGYVRVRQAFPREAALAMQDFMWSELKRLHGFERDDPATWSIAGWTPSQWTRLGLNKTKDHRVYDGIASPRLMGAFEELVGPARAAQKQSWGAFTVTFPETADKPWDIGCDWRRVPQPRADIHGLVGVSTFYSHVAPQGGGPLFVEGSHRLVTSFFDSLSPDDLRGHPSSLRSRLFRSHPWLAELTGKTADRGDRIRRFMEEETLIDDVPVRVVELTGEPGDAVFYHPAILRSPSPNLSDVPRFMRG